MEGYVSDFNDMNYVETLKSKNDRQTELCLRKDVEDGGYNALPTQAKRSFSKSYWRSTQFRSGKF